MTNLFKINWRYFVSLKLGTIKFAIIIIFTLLSVLFTPFYIYASKYLEGEEAYLQSLENAQEIEYNQKDMCVDILGRCLETKKVKIIEGVAVERDCWKYELIKKCNNVPSKDNCDFIQQDDFKYIGDTCISKIKIGNKYLCANVMKTFAKTTYQKDAIDHSKIIMDPDDEKAAKNLLCKSFCLDGNCDEVHKATHKNNDEIAESIAQLEMLSGIKKGRIDSNNIKFDIFGGSPMHCHENPLKSNNCCNESGWFKSIGLQSCNPQVKKLVLEVRKKRCKYVGEYCAKRDKITKTCWRKTKTYCCYPTILAKTIRLGAESQLGKGIGSPDQPQCGGLDITDIESLDFGLIDFQEFFDHEVQPMMKNYSSEDNEALVKRSFPSGSHDKGSNSFSGNGADGVNEKLFQNSSEGGE